MFLLILHITRFSPCLILRFQSLIVRQSPGDKFFILWLAIDYFNSSYMIKMKKNLVKISIISLTLVAYRRLFLKFVLNHIAMASISIDFLLNFTAKIITYWNMSDMSVYQWKKVRFLGGPALHTISETRKVKNQCAIQF